MSKVRREWPQFVKVYASQGEGLRRVWVDEDPGFYQLGFAVGMLTKVADPITGQEDTTNRYGHEGVFFPSDCIMFSPKAVYENQRGKHFLIVKGKRVYFSPQEEEDLEYYLMNERDLA